MIWGWIGGSAFLLIFVYQIKKLLTYLSTHYKSAKFIIQPIFGMFLFLIFFLINEYKMTPMSYANYFMIIWIFMGIGYSLNKLYAK